MGGGGGGWMCECGVPGLSAIEGTFLLSTSTHHPSSMTCHPSPMTYPLSRVELQTLLGAIGTDIRKRMDGKRKKVEALTQTTVAANSKRSLDLFQRQQGER